MRGLLSVAIFALVIKATPTRAQSTVPDTFTITGNLAPRASASCSSGYTALCPTGDACDCLASTGGLLTSSNALVGLPAGSTTVAIAKDKTAKTSTPGCKPAYGEVNYISSDKAESATIDFFAALCPPLQAGGSPDFSGGGAIENATLVENGTPTNVTGFGTLTGTYSPATGGVLALTLNASVTAPVVVGLNFSHVFVVEEENNTYSTLVGNNLMPYLNSLMQQYALSTGYYANTHGSITDYLWMVTGQRVTTGGTTNVDNIVRQLTTNGLSWREYAEGLPSVGFLGGSVGTYAAGHNPFVSLSDVVGSPAQKANVLPFTSFATDLNTYNFANANFITPDLCDDLHANAGCTNGCTNPSLPACYTAADNWLQTNLGPLIATPEFQAHDLLIIWTDEAAFSDSTHGGGQVAWVAISGRSKAGPIKATTLEQHQNTLALICSALGTSACPGAAQRAWPMSEYFN